MTSPTLPPEAEALVQEAVRTYMDAGKFDEWGLMLFLRDLARRLLEPGEKELAEAKAALKGAVDRPAVALLDPDRPPGWLTRARAIYGHQRTPAEVRIMEDKLPEPEEEIR